MTNDANCQFQFIPIDDIELDLNNPRIARWIEIYGENPTSEQIALALGRGQGIATTVDQDFIL